MHCNDAGQLMLAILDHDGDLAEAKELSLHIRGCKRCAYAWRSLSQAEALLRSQSLAEPPPGFVASVSEALLQERSRPPAWQRRLVEAAAVLAGGLVLLSALAALCMAIADALGDPKTVAAAEVLMRAGTAAAASMLGAVDSGPVMWIMYGLLAMTMAMFWFGALVVPLHARRLVRSRA